MLGGIKLTTNYQIKRTREAADVKRFHTFPSIREQTVGQHSFNMLTMLFQFVKEPSLNLIKAITYHDFAERWVGDIPATAKWGNEEWGNLTESIEESVRLKLGFISGELTEDEKNIVSFLDTLELFYWALEEAELGNKNGYFLAKKVRKIVLEKYVKTRLQTTRSNLLFRVDLQHQRTEDGDAFN